MTRSWRQPADDTERSPLFNGVRDNRMDHPAYNRQAPTDVPPSIRVGFRVACSPIAADRPSTSDLRRALLRTLGRPEITDLIGDVTGVENMTWSNRGSQGRHNVGAVLNDFDETVAPFAWARLLLPDPALQLHWRDSRCADFILHIDSRTRRGVLATPRDLATWHRWFTRAFTILEIVSTRLLMGELRLTTEGDPAATLAVWLDTPRHLEQLVDIRSFNREPGTYISRQFAGYAVAADTGASPAAVATSWIRQLCDNSLHIYDYEEELLSIGNVDLRET